MKQVSARQFDYQRIAAAIDYISENHLRQPSLEEVAGAIAMSPFHFQRLFTRWAGVSPKKFLQYATLSFAKERLSRQVPLAAVSLESGLSGSGRLHDLFVNFEAMTPGEYKRGGEGLAIQYSWASTLYGTALIARTSRGICHLAFEDEFENAISRLQNKFPAATFTEEDHPSFSRVLQVLVGDDLSEPIPLHVKGTPFQVKVWEALLKIPVGAVTTYGSLAHDLGMPKASRAVGTAIGNNPVALLIPCHRVIQATGMLGGYHWGLTRKKVILAREAASTDLTENHAATTVNTPL